MSQDFAVALRKTFGLPNQTTASFAKELRELNDADRAYYSRIMKEAGIEHEPPKPKQA